MQQVLFPLTEDDCEPGEFQKVQDLKATLELDGEEHMVLRSHHPSRPRPVSVRSRFLRARDGEMEQAKSMLEDHLAWRAEKGSFHTSRQHAFHVDVIEKMLCFYTVCATHD